MQIIVKTGLFEETTAEYSAENTKTKPKFHTQKV